mgnify:CR=1 FL=1
MKIRADKSAVKHIKIAAKDVKYGSTQLFSSSPALSPTVTFRLKLTPELEKIAEYAGKHGLEVSVAQLTAPFGPSEVIGLEAVG